MDYIIGGDQIDLEDFSSASIYLDACFILTFLDNTDSRQREVARVLNVWAEYDDVKLGMSNHTVSEVINRLFQIKILGSIESYYKMISPGQNRGRGQRRHKQGTSPIDNVKLINMESARYLYQLAKGSGLLDRLSHRDFYVNVSEIVKLAKQDEEKRHLLDIYYGEAVDTFNAFISIIEGQLMFKVELLDSLYNPHYDLAKSQMKMMQLDITDSFHLAIAIHNNYLFLATLDGDFVHNGIPALSTRIIKVA